MNSIGAPRSVLISPKRKRTVLKFRSPILFSIASNKHSRGGSRPGSGKKRETLRAWKRTWIMLELEGECGMKQKRGEKFNKAGQIVKQGSMLWKKLGVETPRWGVFWLGRRLGIELTEFQQKSLNVISVLKCWVWVWCAYFFGKRVLSLSDIRYFNFFTIFLMTSFCKVWQLKN